MNATQITAPGAPVSSEQIDPTALAHSAARIAITLNDPFQDHPTISRSAHPHFEIAFPAAVSTYEHNVQLDYVYLTVDAEHSIHGTELSTTIAGKRYELEELVAYGEEPTTIPVPKSGFLTVIINLIGDELYSNAENGARIFSELRRRIEDALNEQNSAFVCRWILVTA